MNFFVSYFKLSIMEAENRCWWRGQKLCTGLNGLKLRLDSIEFSCDLQWFIWVGVYLDSLDYLMLPFCTLPLILPCQRPVWYCFLLNQFPRLKIIYYIYYCFQSFKHPLFLFIGVVWNGRLDRLLVVLIEDIQN